MSAAPFCWAPATVTTRSSRAAVWARMSAMSRRETSPVPSNTAVARSGSSVCTCTFSVRASPTTSTESPSRSSGAMKRAALSPSPVTAKLVQKRYVPELCSG